jgi:hypothetical protein
MTNTDECTCVCTTEDFRAVDEICPDSDCLWGRDPNCPEHARYAVAGAPASE